MVSRKSRSKRSSRSTAAVRANRLKPRSLCFVHRLRNGGSRGDEAGFQPFRKEPVRVAATFSNEGVRGSPAADVVTLRVIVAIEQARADRPAILQPDYGWVTSVTRWW